MYKLLLIPCLFLSLISCVSQKTALVDTLDFSTENQHTFTHNLWQVEQINETELPNNIKATLLVGNNNDISGNSGCNQYHSQITLDKNQLNINQGISTRMACLPALMTIENNFLNALNATKTYNIDNHGKLNFYDIQGNNNLTFSQVTNAYQALSGSVYYRERIALPPNAILTIKLLDVSIMDAPAKVIATKTYNLKGQQVPINFTIKYLTEKINSRHTYSVQAQIKQDDTLLFTSTSATPVITRTGKQPINILLEKVQPATSSKSTSVNYLCERNTSLTVTFVDQTTVQGEQQKAIINLGDNQPLILPQAPSASGFLYSNGKVSLRGKGDKAIWTVGRMRGLQCKVE